MQMRFALSILAAGWLGAADERILRVHGASTGGAFTHVVARGESLASLGARFGIDTAVIARENELAAGAVLRAGQTLAVDNRHVVVSAPGARIVVNVPQRMLFYNDDETSLAFPVAVGRPDWRTRIDAFTVVAKEENPTWDVPISIQEEMRRKGQPVRTQVPPGPDNPLGRYWLGLSLPGIGIHGTSAPTSIYRYATHGCIRLHPDDAADLFAAVEVGTEGRVVYEPVMLALVGEELFLEAHRDIYGLRERDAFSPVRQTIEALGYEDAVDWTAVREVLARRDGVARPIGRKMT